MKFIYVNLNYLNISLYQECSDTSNSCTRALSISHYTVDNHPCFVEI